MFFNEPARGGPSPSLLAAALHGDVAGGDDGEDDDDVGGGEQPGAVLGATKPGDERPGAHLNPHHQPRGAEHNCSECAMCMPDERRRERCGGSFHPGVRTVTSELRGLEQKCGDVEAGDGGVWRDGHADASLAGWEREETRSYPEFLRKHVAEELQKTKLKA